MRKRKLDPLECKTKSWERMRCYPVRLITNWIYAKEEGILTQHCFRCYGEITRVFFLLLFRFQEKKCFLTTCCCGSLYDLEPSYKWLQKWITELGRIGLGLDLISELVSELLVSRGGQEERSHCIYPYPFTNLVAFRNELDELTFLSCMIITAYVSPTTFN